MVWRHLIPLIITTCDKIDKIKRPAIQIPPSMLDILIQPFMYTTELLMEACRIIPSKSSLAEFLIVRYQENRCQYIANLIQQIMNTAMQTEPKELSLSQCHHCRLEDRIYLGSGNELVIMEKVLADYLCTIENLNKTQR